MISTLTLSTQIQCGTAGNQTHVNAERGHVGNGDDQIQTVGPAESVARKRGPRFSRA